MNQSARVDGPAAAAPSCTGARATTDVDVPSHQQTLPQEAFDLRSADRDAAIAHLFATHYHGLLRLAFLLGSDDDTEDVVAEAFYQLHRRWNRLRTPQAALGYLRSTVCNLARMRLRHLRVVRRHAQRHVEGLEPSAESQVIVSDEHRRVVQALRSLPARQHQALVLRYWLDLKESEIAETMCISAGAVKSHVSRGMAKLGKLMEAASG
ncbi:sigma-70 family RNA polymerase sigma factor [Streptomyces decoyicus]|uniref:Sigma-70 family RNA polymerase sigma factor n=1 Tax=Streptomyces decoyicus TaxID=249567 RepID=A0ABZ1FCW4_9ACTN|nr:sigma-70 family RNA polymerase sigma factor [Streptomyces decoyicus]WSB68202.1 sigma-70 family RNA polymerase sigma factor [Streptomyces decoyicus]